jgi:glyoxylase-like metal-dependent hydrolase (beta-lactamase superfamily II)
VVPANLVFDKELTLTLGSRPVILHDWGKANSPHDVTVYLPDEKILFTGDILVEDPLPYTGASWPVPWAEVLRQLDAMPAAIVVPGHGPLRRDHTYIHQVRQLMEAVTARVESFARKGLTLDQVQDSVSLEDLRSGFPAWAGAPADDWKIVMRALVERAWRGVRGQGG